MNESRVEIDGRNRKLIFRGTCLEMLPICCAACCRNTWSVGLTLEEYKSGLYEVAQICLLTGKECDKNHEKCVHRSYELKKNKDGACVHLNESNRCSIYENRPQVCRDFSCSSGWRFDSVLASDKGKTSPQPALAKEVFVERLTDDLAFVAHPLIKLHAVFYIAARDEIIFLKEMVEGCGKFHTKDSFHSACLDDDHLFALANAFSSKNKLGRIYQQFCDHYGELLTKQEFYEIVWLLNRHSIILSAAYFHGMLAGVGAL